MEYDSVSLLRRGKDQEFFPNVDSVITCTASFHLQDTDIFSMSVHRDALRNPREVVLKTIFLFLVVVGALGNVILFFHSISPILFGQKKRYRCDSHTLGAGQSPDYFLLWDSPYNGSFCFEEAPEQSLV